MPSLRTFFILVFSLTIGNNASSQNVKLVLPSGHLERVSDIEFSEDDQWMASASVDNSVKIWSTVNGKLLQSLEGHTEEVFKVFFFPGGKKLLTASRDRTIRVWDIYKGQSLVEYAIEEGIIEIFLTRDGKRIIIVALNKIITLDPETGKEISVTRDKVMGTSVTAELNSAENSIVLTKNFNINEPQVRVWDLFSNKNYPVELEGCPYGAQQSFFYGDSLLISHCKDNEFYISNYRTGKSTIIECTEEIREIFPDPGGNSITAVFANDKIFKGRPEELMQANLSEGKSGKYQVVKYNPSRKSYFLLSGNEYGQYDNLYDLKLNAGQAPEWSKVNSPARLTNVFFSRSGKYQAMLTDDGKIRLQNASSGELLFTLSNHLEGVNAMYCIKNDVIITGDGNGFLKKWEMNSGKLTKSRKLSDRWIEAIDYSQKDSVVAVGTGSGIIHLIRLSDFSSIADFKLDNSSVTACAFSNDGRYVAGYMDNTETNVHHVIVWDIQSKKQVFSKTGFFYKGHSPFVNNSDMILFADYEDMSLHLYDFKTGRLVNKMKTGLEIQNFSTSADGSIMVAASKTDQVKWWTVRDQKPLGQAKKTGAEFTDAAISPDNKIIVSNAYDGAIDIWEVSSGKLLGRVNAGFGYNRMKFISSRKLILESNKIVYSLDLDNMKLETIGSGTWLQQWQNQSWFDNPESIVTVANGSSFSFFPLNKKSGPTIFCNIDSLEYLTLLPNGYYLSSPRASKLLHYVTPELKVITFDQLDVKYNRPDIVLENIGKSDASLVNSLRQAYHKRVKKLGVDTTAFSDGMVMPEGDFTNRSEISYEQKEGRLILKISGNEKKSRLEKFQLWINETPLFGMKGIQLGKRQITNFDTSITINLSAGLNIFETSFTNSNGIESYRMPLTVFYQPPIKVDGKMYFIGIGIDRFNEPGHNLNYSVKDIRDLAVKLKEKYKENIYIDTLFNEKVTNSNVAALKRSLLGSGVNDKIILSYSGHGLLSKDYDYYLSTYPVNFAQPEINGLPYEMLESLMDSVPARKKLMLIDACHSGEVDKEEMQKYKAVQSQNKTPGLKGLDIENTDSTSKMGMKNSFELMQELFANVGRSTGTTIISAAAGTQLAQERGDLKNGVFTYSILEYLQSHPSVNISALREYVNKRVPELTSGLQVPTTRTETNQLDWEL